MNKSNLWFYAKIYVMSVMIALSLVTVLSWMWVYFSFGEISFIVTEPNAVIRYIEWSSLMFAPVVGFVMIAEEGIKRYSNGEN